ncbi:MAG TPA: hypothetical protein VNE39_21880 [Planctomycetota bacterium]|nr:hypothetical protein [Planctomycetota bacterium]
MSGKTQFWLGSLMLALAVGILVGGLFDPKPSYSQDIGEGRTGNFALVASNLQGNRPKSQIVYVIDDRNEALYVIETSALRGDEPSPRGYLDLREMSTAVQKKRAERDKRIK